MEHKIGYLIAAGLSLVTSIGNILLYFKSQEMWNLVLGIILFLTAILLFYSANKK